MTEPQAHFASMRLLVVHSDLAALFFATCLLVIAVAPGCGRQFTDDERRMLEDAHLVTPYLDKKSLVEKQGFAFGRLKEGTAVLGADGEAFWVKDGQSYVVNEAAKAIAPELPLAPESITFEDVILALGTAQQ